TDRGTAQAPRASRRPVPGGDRLEGDRGGDHRRPPTRSPRDDGTDLQPPRSPARAARVARHPVWIQGVHRGGGHSVLPTLTHPAFRVRRGGARPGPAPGLGGGRGARALEPPRRLAGQRTARLGGGSGRPHPAALHPPLTMRAGGGERRLATRTPRQTVQEGEMVTTDLTAPPFTLDVRVARSPLVGLRYAVDGRATDIDDLVQRLEAA